MIKFRAFQEKQCCHCISWQHAIWALENDEVATWKSPRPCPVESRGAMRITRTEWLGRDLYLYLSRENLEIAPGDRSIVMHNATGDFPVSRRGARIVIPEQEGMFSEMHKDDLAAESWTYTP